MKAAVLEDKHKIVVKELPKPEINENEVLIKVAYCGICGSDYHAYNHLIFPPGTVLGHELTGIVEEVGGNITKVEPGQRVVVRPPGICDCYFCKRGQLSLCENHFENTVGLKIPGGYQEYIKTEEYKVFPLPASISLKEGAQLEPLSVAVHAVRNSSLDLGDTVVILGAGSLGLLVLQGVKLRGAKNIVMVDVREKPLKLARELGADTIINGRNQDVLEELSDLFVDIVFDMVGKNLTFNQSLKLIRKGGQIDIVGASTEMVEFDQLDTLQRAIDIKNSMGYFVDDFEIALNGLASNLFEVDSLVTNIVKLEDLENKDFWLNGPEDRIKVLISYEND